MELWFTERHTPYVNFSIKVERQLYTAQSEFQRIDVFESREFGRFLTLDGYMMLTEKDEFIYHEMITHIPMAVHPNPENILVIGAGDGGVVRELTRYQSPKCIDLVEIDELVIEVCRKYLPKTACRLDDPRVHIHIADGLKFIRSCENKYDLIIVDSTDPFGPGEGLFTKEFYGSCYNALREDGIMVNQSIGCSAEEIPSRHGLQSDASWPFYPLLQCEAAPQRLLPADVCRGCCAMWSRNKERSLWQNYWSLAAAALQVAIQKCCQNDGLFTELVLASRTKAKCDALKEKLAGKTKTVISTAEVDADNVAALCVLIRDVRPDAVLNLALPYQDLSVMEACLECGVDYIDTANYEPENTDDPAWREIYESAARSWASPPTLTIRGSGPMTSASARPA